jgi:hypothetical protein
MPNVGKIEVHFGGGTLRPEPDVTILGAESGAQTGSALATGDLDGDGVDDLVIGSPGTQDTRGAVTAIYGVATWPAVIDLAALPSEAAQVLGLAQGDQLGESLALVDLDGDGKLEVLAGAPEADKVYVLDASDLGRGKRGLVGARAVTGPSGSGFGRAFATRGTLIAVGAPLESTASSTGAVYLLPAGELASARDTSGLPRLLGRGGGFGTALRFADVDGNGAPSLVASAPQEGAGTVFIVPLASLTSDRQVTEVERTVRTLAPVGALGSALGSLPWPLGDALVLGAPSPLPTDNPGAGTLFVVRGPTLSGKLSALRLEADGRPAATVLSGAHPGDGLGSQIVVGDVNQDGRLDILVAAAKAKTVYLVPGPLL